MKLNDIIERMNVVAVHGRSDVEISALCSDSRKVTAGALFVAVKGYASDGHSYIPQALEKGAVAVICETLPEEFKADVTFIVVENSRRAVALAADAF